MTAICLETEIKAIGFDFAQYNAAFMSTCVQNNKFKQWYDKEKNVICLYEIENSTSEDELNDDLKSESARIKNIILDENWIKGVKMFEWQETYYVALLSKPFCLKSERDGNIKDLVENLRVVTEKDLYLTFDLGVFRNIDEEPSEKHKERYSGIIKRTGIKI